MDEQVKTLVDAVLGAEGDTAVEIYLAAPKAVRRSAYSQIRAKDAGLGKKIRAAAEKRRGIAFRTQEGVPVRSREAYVAEALRLQGKHNAMDERKATLASRLVEVKKQAQEFYGDDLLAEIETALENA